jgi:hypothetical protein
MNKIVVKTASSKTINMKKFLLEEHHIDNIKVFKSTGLHWNWAKQIRHSSLSRGEGMFIFVNKNDQVLYIGQSGYIYSYINYLTRIFGSEPKFVPDTIYIITNKNPSFLVHAVTAYRAKFNPTFNAAHNKRFMFCSTSTMLNLPKASVAPLEWIANNPDSKRRDFIREYTNYDLVKISKSLGCKTFSYKEAKVRAISLKRKA